MNRKTPEIANNPKIGFRRIWIDVFMLPLRAGIIKAMPAPGGAEIISNQSAGYQMVYRKISQCNLLSSFIPFTRELLRHNSD
jgi:hypothetical protein